MPSSGEVWRGTAILARELRVALQDSLAILIGGVPDLGAAVPADDAGSEHAATVVPPARTLAPLQLDLHQFPLLELDDIFMTMLDIILRHFALVLLHFFCKKSII